MLHIVQNDPEVPPGGIVDALDIPFQLHHPYRDGLLPEPADISSLIVLGGAMGANDDARYPFLTGLKRLIGELVAAGIPYLGVCLGGQLLAAALGGRVVANRWEEVGTSRVALTPAGKADPLFRGVPERFTTFQWHHDSFDLPSGAQLLASSPVCPHQAFRVGERSWGLQFHPEVTGKIIADWCAWDPATRVRTAELVAAWRGIEAAYRDTARTLVANFLSVRDRGNDTGTAGGFAQGP